MMDDRAYRGASGSKEVVEEEGGGINGGGKYIAEMVY